MSSGEIEGEDAGGGEDFGYAEGEPDACRSENHRH